MVNMLDFSRHVVYRFFVSVAPTNTYGEYASTGDNHILR